MNPKFHEEVSAVQATDPRLYSRWSKLIAFAIVVGSLAIGGRLLWLALKNEPMNPPPFSPFIAFAIAVIILTYDDMADQAKSIFKKKLNAKRPPAESDPVLLHAKHPLTEKDIMMLLEKAQSGVPLEELAQEYRFSEEEFNTWKVKYGDLNSTLVRQLLELKEENRRLKEMYADLSFEYHRLRELHHKKDE